MVGSFWALDRIWQLLMMFRWIGTGDKVIGNRLAVC